MTEQFAYRGKMPEGIENDVTGPGGGLRFLSLADKDISTVSRQISQITKTDPLLAPQTRRGVEQDIKDNKYAILANMEDAIVGFLKINPLAKGWAEVGTSYVNPNHRNLGIQTRIKQKILSENPSVNTISITANPAVDHINEKLGFERYNWHSLPPHVLIALLKSHSSTPDKVMFQLMNLFQRKHLWVKNHRKNYNADP